MRNKARSNTLVLAEIQLTPRLRYTHFDPRPVTHWRLCLPLATTFRVVLVGCEWLQPCLSLNTPSDLQPIPNRSTDTTRSDQPIDRARSERLHECVWSENVEIDPV